jgi:hypothetical protein
MTTTVATPRRTDSDSTVLPATSLSSVHAIRMPAPGVDIALLASALFLQRFSLSFSNTILSLDLVAAALILVHQFAANRLLILYDRLLWFLVLGITVSCSMLLSFNSRMLTSYCLLILMYFMFTLYRPGTPARYNGTLRAFQFVLLILSFLAVAQFFAQFFVDGRSLVEFYGVVPEFLLTSYYTGVVNTVIPITAGSSLIKSNAIFLVEPSTLSLITALGILIEVLEFRRLRYLFFLALSFLLSYSGTGLVLLLLFLPVAALAKRRVLPYALLVIIFAVVLLGSGIVDLSAFTSRTGEFEDPAASGFARYVAPFWLAGDYIHSATPGALLLGNGPGTAAAFASASWYSSTTGTWIKLFYEYGLMGSLVLILFFAGCLKETLCPKLIVAALIFSYFFLSGSLLSTPFLILMVVLLTLGGREAANPIGNRQ